MTTDSADECSDDCACLNEAGASDEESLGLDLGLGEEMTEWASVRGSKIRGWPPYRPGRGRSRARGGVERAADEGVEGGTTERDRAVAKCEENRESCETTTVTGQGDAFLRPWRRAMTWRAWHDRERSCRIERLSLH